MTKLNPSTKNLINVNDLVSRLISEYRSKDVFIDNGHVECKFIDTGNLALNYIMSGSFDGGLPEGQVTEIYGEPSSGKSLLLYNIIANFQKKYKDGIVILDDTENAYVEYLGSTLNIDANRLIKLTSSTVEEHAAVVALGGKIPIREGDKIKDIEVEPILDKIVKSGVKEILVAIDSIAVLSTRHELDVGLDKPDMSKAKTLKALLRLITPIIKRYNVTYIITNHLIQMIGSMFPMKITPGGCIEAGNKVITDKGMLNIEEIYRNFSDLKPIKVISFNKESKSSEWQCITNVYRIDVEKNNKIKVNFEYNFNIVTSDWHKFFVAIPNYKKKNKFVCMACKKEYISYGALSVHLWRNKNCKSKHSILGYTIIEKRADELQSGDFVIRNDNNLLSMPEFDDLSNELAWLIGYFIGDGSLDKNRVRFYDSNIKKLEQVALIIKRNFSVSSTSIRKNKNCYCICINKKNVINFFVNLGFNFGRKARTVRITNKLRVSLNKNNFNYLMAGLLDSDGNLSKRRNSTFIKFTTASKNLFNDIYELLIIAGIKCCNNVTKRDTTRADLHVIIIYAKEAYKLLNNIKLSFMCSQIKPIAIDALDDLINVELVTSTSKTNINDKYFYDLTVENNQNYLAGNKRFIFIHNSGVVYQSSIRLGLMPHGKLKTKETNTILGVISEITTTKNRFAPPFRKCELEIWFDKGMSKYSGLISLLTNLGIIKLGDGGWYETVNNSFKFQSKDIANKWMELKKLITDKKILQRELEVIEDKSDKEE